MLDAAREKPRVIQRIRKLTEDNAHIFPASHWPLTFAHPPTIERLDEIRAPTILLIGDRDDEPLRKIADLLDSRIPDSRKVVISGAGHMLNMEKPREFNRAVIEFLRRQ